MFFLGFVLAFCWTIYVYSEWYLKYWKNKGVPGPEPSVPFGNTGIPFVNKKQMFHLVQEFYEEFKDKGEKHCGFYMFIKPIYVPIDPELIKNILLKDFEYFTDKGFYYNEKVDPLSAHLFSIDGEKWRKLRTKTTPTFTSGKMKMMFPILLKCGEQLQEEVQKLTIEKQPLDIKELLAKYSTDVIGSCAFGIECNSFKDPEAEFREKGRRIFQASFLDQIKGLTAFTSPKLGRILGLRVIHKDVSDFFLDFIKKAVEYREETNYRRSDFLQLMIDLKNSESQENCLTFEELAANSFVFFLAGFETSSTTMQFCLYELAQNEEIQQLVRDEIEGVLERNGGEITYDVLSEMKYLQCVIEETLRKYPPLNFINRKCTKPYKIPDTEIVLEKDQLVFVPVYAIHHDPEFYPEPEKFEPRRFFDGEKKKRHQYCYLPFGEGPRNCIGLRFGLMQTKVGLAYILKNFKFTLNEQTKTPLEIDPLQFILTAKNTIYLNSVTVN